MGLDRLKRKLNSTAAFTLAETLLAVLILLLVSGIVAGGVPAARNAYEKVMLESNSEVLLSTTVTALRNELGTAAEIEAGTPDDSGTVTEILYERESASGDELIGSKSKIRLAGAEDAGEPAGVILYERYADTDLTLGGGARRLVSKEASTGDLYVTYESVRYDEAAGIITFSGLSVDRESGRKGLAKLDTFSIRVL